jgi:hypothetical protein
VNLARISICFLVTVLGLGQTAVPQSVPVTNGREMPPVIVVGFVGGFIRHDNLAHSEVQLAGAPAPELPLGGGR